MPFQLKRNNIIKFDTFVLYFRRKIISELSDLSVILL
jgi:hypothetical protein